METYNGHVRTPADAIILFEACRLGLLPRVQRRLSEKERQSIKSGSVFVWDEREAGMRRWTDGKSWSASRVSGSFLTYREMEGKRGGNGFAPPIAATQQRAGRTPDSTRGSDSDQDMDGPDGYKYKPDGLMKQSFSITTSTGQHLHLISYYARSHPAAQGLNQPTSDSNLRHIRPQKGMYPESTVHEQQNVPAVTRGPMPGASFAMSSHNMPTGPPAFARSSASHSQSFGPPPGYGWPPNPMSTPPNHQPSYYSPGGYPQQLPQQLTASNVQSPLQYGHPPPTTSQAPSTTQFDRPPAPLLSSSLPPPPPHHQRNNAPVPAMSQLYVPNPSPRVAQAEIVAQQQGRSPQNGRKYLGSSSSSPSLSKIDPRLTSPLAQQPITHSNGDDSKTRSRSGSSSYIEKTDATPSRENGTPSANMIPSIGSIMNDTSNDTSDAKSDKSGSRAGSRSPGGTHKRDGPQDIPSEKLGFREDMRALRVLDRAFSA
ncbi:MAG: hypothetical protein M1812_001068 [Candelaria pacifica]|nr:MAG: hypothetical protein M1812_001068 [Candelaria pacifica]